MAKKKVELVRKSRGYERGDVVEVDAERAEALVREGLAREPQKATKKADS